MNIVLKTKTLKDSIVYYLNILQNFHKLTSKELDVFVEVILKYLECLDTYKNEEAANKLYLAKESREELLATLNIKSTVFRNYLTTFKKKLVLDKNNIINKVLLPKVEKGEIVLNFRIQQNEVPE